MRDYKFRAKRIDNGEWVIGYYVHDDFKGYDGRTGIVFADDPLGFQVLEVDPATVGQFTGLPDKNGVDIYEHDIVKDQHGQLFVIRWNEHWGAFCLAKVSGVKFKNGEPWYDSHNPIYSGLTQYENNGTIHDNPSLVQGGDER